jgi:hypothetical protein
VVKTKYGYKPYQLTPQGFPDTISQVRASWMVSIRSASSHKRRAAKCATTNQQNEHTDMYCICKYTYPNVTTKALVPNDPIEHGSTEYMNPKRSLCVCSIAAIVLRVCRAI